MPSAVIPITIQQPFVYFPNNSIPVLWNVVSGVTWSTTKTPVTDCTGSLTLYDPQGNAVSGATGLFAQATTTPGLYQFVIDAGSDGSLFHPDVGRDYKTVITMNSPTVGGPARWTIPSVVRARANP